MASRNATVVSGGPAGADAQRVWLVVVLLFAGASIWPLFARYPPMQDYPQYLAVADVLANAGDRTSDAARTFETHLHATYTAFYLIALGLSKVMSIEAAGRLAACLYPMLVAGLVWRIRRLPGTDANAWGAVLFFPMAFQQQYVLGNLNYLLAIPVVFLALLDYEELLEGRWRWPLVARLGVWLLVLATAHPLGVIGFGVLAAIMLNWFRLRTDVRPDARSVTVVIAAVVLLFLILGSDRSTGDGASVQVDYLPARATSEFFLLMFNDMGPLATPQPLALGIWTALLALVAGACVLEWRSATRVTRLYLWMIAIAGASLFVLPFRAGPFTFLNTRVSAVLYFLIALLASRIRFAGVWRAAVVALAAACLMLSLRMQARLSHELDDITPVVDAIPAHARVLPLVFDNDSPELDSRWFDFHLHALMYYHVARGGFGPYFFTMSSQPISYRDDARRPAPGEYEPQKFSWEAHAADYQYFVVRNAPLGFSDYLTDHGCEPVMHSGPWGVFRRGWE